MTPKKQRSVYLRAVFTVGKRKNQLMRDQESQSRVTISRTFAIVSAFRETEGLPLLGSS
jgi:hypothetical protein